MLIKEYRIALPLTVEEYRIAQLYMIAKKSREESRGAGSGVEILVNEPYTDGPGGNGQYTHKIFHVGSHLPGWFKALLPKSALIVEERAWNAYPYTKTRYTCPFVEKFFLEIETKYLSDCGDNDNVFDLNGSELRSRIVDTIDVVKDQLVGADYKSEEDPKLYVSQKTHRGPLTDCWLDEYSRESNSRRHGSKDIMCAYKLCRVEFKYWGMQSKIEKFIHDMALRKTMLRAHRQAWAWQDEWVGLTMEDIRRLERETQEALAKKMGCEAPSTVVSSPTGSQCHLEDRTDGDDKVFEEHVVSQRSSGDNSDITPRLSPSWSPNNSPRPHKPHDLPIACDETSESSLYSSSLDKRKWIRTGNRSLHSPGCNSNKSFDLQIANWRMESCVRTSDSSSEDEFFDCEEELDSRSTLTKWSSLEFLNEEENTSPTADLVKEDPLFKPSLIQRVTSEQYCPVARPLQPSCSMDQSLPCSPTLSPAHHPCPVTVLILVVHGGSILDTASDYSTKKSDMATFRAAFNLVCKQHYPSMSGHVAIRLVACPQICLDAFGILSSLSPYSFEALSSPSTIDGGANPASYTQDFMPISAIPLFATASVEYNEIVSRVISNANQVYLEFLHSEEGIGFCGQVVLIGDSVGSVVAYDALCRPNQYGRYGSETSLQEAEPLSPGLAPKVNPLISISDGNGDENHDEYSRENGKKSNTVLHLTHIHSHSSSAPSSASAFNKEGGETHLTTTPLFRRRSSCSSEQSHVTKLEFDVSDFIMFGSPLGMILAFRKIHSFDDKSSVPPRPVCTQVYNLFHPMDPLASRLEPLISLVFSRLQPVKIARYAKYPLGDGHPCHLLECIHSSAHQFLETLGGNVPVTPGSSRRLSEASIQSAMSGVDSVPLQAISSITQKWWGQKRLDYDLYCPEGLTNFPINALPHIFHASYWESSDVIAFILRQISRMDTGIHHGNIEKEGNIFSPSQPREKWTKKRTSVKLKNVNANHRANDVVVKEGLPQVLTARFMYGPIDMVALTGEKVDIHIMRDPPLGEWIYLSTEVTEKSGRIIYTIPESKMVGLGVYPVKMVVRGDHTSVDSYLVVVPPKTECVVFSIDGSFTASVSVTGRDPKVRAGAVDVVRHWQELGYLLVYITGRPDMQQQRVVSWLAQHNFPHGVVSFVDGLSTDPLRHKAEYLKHLVQDADVVIHSAYGSSKDIAMYSSVGLKSENIYIVGKVSKKQHAQAQVSSHKPCLMHGGSRTAKGNARMVIPRGCFGLPGQNPGLRRRRSAKRTTSYPITTPSASESISRARGVSPRPQSSRV
ncbi:hypothetical protein CHUAL_004450 [Chamberlinius hualienensis]